MTSDSAKLLSNLKHCTGDLLKADTDALVNAVNLCGVMGKGIAQLFKERYQDNYLAYRSAFMAGELCMGKMFIFTRLDQSPKYIVNFPTKEHWRNRSRLDFIENGLRDLVESITKLKIGSIAVPALGCGNGGLDWSTVEPLIEFYLGNLPDTKVLVFPPQ